MWHKALRIRNLMRIETTHEGFLVYLANHNTSRVSLKPGVVEVVYKAFSFDLAPSRMNKTPNETQITHKGLLVYLANYSTSRGTLKLKAVVPFSYYLWIKSIFFSMGPSVINKNFETITRKRL